jgi:DNA-binding winged helix-turn-helix (wHTH) protein/tetratricopeptide (TPR) repeat protein
VNDTQAAQRTGSADAAAPEVVLAHEPAFTLGRLSVEPALRRISRADGAEEILQPRVMQVLVALARADGAILTRDELMDQCWRGVVVGEDALNRAVGHLRKSLDDIAGGELLLETIPKVGCRLRRPGATPQTAASPVALGRRRSPWLFAALAAALVVAAGGGWLAWRALAPRPRIEPWSAADMRGTFAIRHTSPAGDPALAAYADQFDRALSARFTPALGDVWLAPDATRAQFSVQLEVRRGGAGVITRIALRERARDAVLGVREVEEPLSPAASMPVVWQASAFVKDLAGILLGELARAKPERDRDVRDYMWVIHIDQGDRAHSDEALRAATTARLLAPRGTLVREALITVLDQRLLAGWASDPRAEFARMQAIDVELLSENPQNLVALQTLTDAYVLKGRWEDALVAADRVLAFRPEDSHVLLDRGQAQLRLGAAPAADATLKRLLDFQTTGSLQVAITQFAGLLRFHQGRAAEAADFLRQSIQLTPADDLARPAFAGARLYLAAAEAEQGRLAEARRVLDEFRAAVLRVKTMQDFLAWNDAARFPLVDEPKLAADLARAGLPER